MERQATADWTVRGRLQRQCCRAPRTGSSWGEVDRHPGLEHPGMMHVAPERKVRGSTRWRTRRRRQDQASRTGRINRGERTSGGRRTETLELPGMEPATPACPRLHKEEGKAKAARPGNVRISGGANTYGINRGKQEEDQGPGQRGKEMKAKTREGRREGDGKETGSDKGKRAKQEDGGAPTDGKPGERGRKLHQSGAYRAEWQSTGEVGQEEASWTGASGEPRSHEDTQPTPGLECPEMIKAEHPKRTPTDWSIRGADRGQGLEHPGIGRPRIGESGAAQRGGEGSDSGVPNSGKDRAPGENRYARGRPGEASVMASNSSSAASSQVAVAIALQSVSTREASNANCVNEAL